MKAFFGLAVLLLAIQSHGTEYLVKYRNSKGLAAIHDMAAEKSASFSIVDQHDPGSYLVLEIPAVSEKEISARLMSDSNIEWMHENGTVSMFTAPLEVPALKTQWAMAKVQAEKAWGRAGNRGSRNVVVAVIDTGVDHQHRALSLNMIPGFDFFDSDQDPMDVTGSSNPGHGTHCAGVIGATGLIEGGTIGLSPEVSIMPIRFLGPRGNGDFNNAVKSIDFAIENGAQVISASWGAMISKDKVMALIEAVKRASDKGIVFVVAAANSSKDNDKTEFYPTNADFGSTIAVAASTDADGRASFSNYGRSTVHVAAPGVGIMSTVPQDKYMEMSGTSMATPLVAGLVALIKAQDPTLTPAQIRALIQSTGVQVNIPTVCNCRIDAFAAVDHLLSKRPWLVPAAGTFEAESLVPTQVMNLEGPLLYTSSNPEVLEVNDRGEMKMLKGGVARVTVANTSGATVSSLDYLIKEKASEGIEECPYSEGVCRWTCRLFPSRPYCKK